MLKNLNRRILRRFEQTRKKLNVLGFDDLNVMSETDVLYKGILSYCREEFAEIYRGRYIEICLWLKRKRPREDFLDELVDMYLAGLLDDPNAVTHYAFESELMRKRDRAKESIMSVPTKMQKQLELQKANRFVAQQVGFYVDITSQDAELQALKDAGVEKVQRHEMDDGKVCEICKQEDGAVYDIDDIPPIPHLRCRRWFTSYSRKT